MTSIMRALLLLMLLVASGTRAEDVCKQPDVLHFATIPKIYARGQLLQLRVAGPFRCAYRVDS